VASSVGSFDRSAVVLPEVRFLFCLFSGWASIAAVSWPNGSPLPEGRWRQQPGTASCYHQLGVIAQDRGLLDEAENWYRRSSAIVEAIDDRPGVAANFGQRGLLAARRGHPEQALELVIRCIALFEPFPHPDTGPAPAHLRRLTTELGLSALERTWRQITGTSLPPEVRLFVQSSPAPDHD
jgi:hypothetical protein